MSNDKVVQEYDYSALRNIPLEEVKSFFNKRAYAELEKLGFTNVGDLLEKDINGELLRTFYEHHNEAYELWNLIHDTIGILKYKYLKIDFNFDVNEKTDFVYKTGFCLSIRKRIGCFDSLSLNNLLKMVDIDDFSKVYEHFKPPVAEEIISKVKVISSYVKNKGIVSIDDLKALYDELFKLVKEHHELGLKIRKIEDQIAEMHKQNRK